MNIQTNIKLDESLRSILESYRLELKPKSPGWYATKCIIEKLGHINLSQLNTSHLSQHRKYRLEKGFSAQTFHHDITHLKNAIKIYCEDTGQDFNERPFKIRMPKINNEIIRRLTDEEWSALSSASLTPSKFANKKWSNIWYAIVLAKTTGMRMSEIVNARVKDFHPGSKVLVIRKTKNGEDRPVPLSPLALEACEYLAVRSKTDTLLGKSYSSFRQTWRRVRARASKECPSLKDFRFHDLRHECLSNLADQNWTIPNLKMVSGHRDTRSLMRYIHPNISNVVDSLQNVNQNGHIKKI